MIRLTDTYTRQGYSLFWAWVWSEGDREALAQWLGPTTRTVVMVRPGGIDKVTAWYDRRELEKSDQAIIEKINGDDEWFAAVRDAYWANWNLLLPYIKQERELTSIDDLDIYYHTWVAWWGPMAVLYYLPNIKAVQHTFREEALRIREKTQGLSDEGGQVIQKFFTRTFPQYEALVHFMTPGEMFSLRDHELNVAQEAVISARFNGWALLNGKLMTTDELDAALVARGLRLGKLGIGKGVSEIHGQIACPGVVRGVVRLVVEERHVYDVREGEILVTEMTTPYFAPAMGRAAAIVTDEGGITCHAAIVARELNKPCVIGTKIATQVLKDGDRVEVDAKVGVVRILSRAETKSEKQPELARA